MSFTLGIIFQGDLGETGPTGQGGLKVRWTWQLMHQIKSSLIRWYFRMFSKPFKEILGCLASLWDLMFSKSKTHTHTYTYTWMDEKDWMILSCTVTLWSRRRAQLKSWGSVCFPGQQRWTRRADFIRIHLALVFSGWVNEQEQSSWLQ